ncbi:MAG: DUF1848 domain-containing protein [Bacilli bacterium]|nr:DUF1848 domain-containing protein [Bacilli bacterium]
MILNVSGRTDIVAFYTDWFMNRLKEGCIDVRNPFNPKLVSRINLGDVDLIFFCTKNPIPILDRIKDINKKIYFHVTLTPYKKEIEPNLPDKKRVIEAIKKLSKTIGKDNIVVRYDPVFLSDTYTLEYHTKAFEKICALLEGYVSKILISFIDDYKNVRKNMNILKYREFTEEDYKTIGTSFSNSAKNHSMVVHTCFEDRDLTEYGFVKDECLSKELAFKLTGKVYKEEWKARKERKCHCVKMVDIGVYNSCKHFCKYCYANYDEKKVIENYQHHNPNSSLLIGELTSDDIIKERKD